MHSILTITIAGIDPLPLGMEVFPLSPRNTVRRRPGDGWSAKRPVSVVPPCAQGLVVDLWGPSKEFLCAGLFLRDDWVLVDRECSMDPDMATVVQPDALYLTYHNATAATLAPRTRKVISRRVVSDTLGVLEVELPPPKQPNPNLSTCGCHGSSDCVY